MNTGISIKKNKMIFKTVEGDIHLSTVRYEWPLNKSQEPLNIIQFGRHFTLELLDSELKKFVVILGKLIKEEK